MEMVKNLADSSHKVIEDFWKLAEEGKMTEAQAKEAVLRAIKSVRYGDGDYFWINDMQPVMIMHPTNPKLDGKDLSAIADPDGKKLFMEFVQVVRQQGKGHVEYLWPKPGFQKPVKKVSYVIGFKQWNWIVGTGVYIDDIQKTFWIEVTKFAVILGVLVLILMVPMLLLFRAIIISSTSLAKKAKELASGEGDLTQRIPVVSRDEIGEATTQINKFVEKIQTIIIDVRSTSEGVASASEQLSSASTQMSSTMNMQAESISQIAAAALEMSQAISTSRENAEEMKRNAETALGAANKGGEVIRRSSGEMQEIVGHVTSAAKSASSLEESAVRVGQVIQVINDIADQTNLLALNAAIEAARAGDAGRGFAVVADEVRKLAERSTVSTAEIIDIVKTIQNGITAMTRAMENVNTKVQHGSALSQEAEGAFHVILENIHALQQIIGHNALSMDEMYSTSEQISDDIQGVSAATEESAKASEEVAGAANNLAQLAGDVKHHLGGFIVDSNQPAKGLQIRS